MNKQNIQDVSEQAREQNELTVPNSKMTFVEPSVSTPEDVLEATTFFQMPTVDIATT